MIRKIFVVIVSMFLIMFSGLYVASYVCGDVIDGKIENSALEQYDVQGQIASYVYNLENEDMLAQMAVYGIVPANYKDTLQSIGDDIKANKKIHKLLVKHSRYLILDVIRGKGYTTKNLNKQVQVILGGYANQIKALFNEDLITTVNQMLGTSYDVDSTVNNLISSINADDLYKKVVDAVRQNLNKEQKTTAKLVYMLSESSTKFNMLMSSLVCIGILIALGWKKLRFLVSIGASFVITGTGLLIVKAIGQPKALSMVESYGTEFSKLVSSEFDTVSKYGAGFLELGAILIIIKIILYWLNKKKLKTAA